MFAAIGSACGLSLRMSVSDQALWLTSRSARMDSFVPTDSDARYDPSIASSKRCAHASMYPAANADGPGQPQHRGRSIPVQQQQQPQQSGLLKSSLDVCGHVYSCRLSTHAITLLLQIVWSYSRSQAFYGSNLDCSPSFISRYRRPGYEEDEEEDDDDGDEDEGAAQDEDLAHTEDGQKDARKSRRRTRSAGKATRRQRASQDSSLANTEEEDEGDDSSNPSGHAQQAEDGQWAPDLDSPSDDRFPSPDRRSSSTNRRKGSSPAAARLRVARKANRIRANQAMAGQQPVQPSYIPSGSSLGLMSEPAYRNSEEGDSSAVNSSDADGKSIADGEVQSRSAKQEDHERTPLLKKGPQAAQLHQSIREEEEALYGSSPPDTVPFPRRSPGMSLRKRSSGGVKTRRKSSAANRLHPQGSSTFGQTLFNAINVLIGIGILALRECISDPNVSA